MILHGLAYDVRLAGRGLCRARTFSAAAILTLALGIAGTTVMFTLVNSVLLRPLPVRDQDRLIVSWKDLRASGYSHHPFGNVAIDAVRDASRLLEMVAGVDPNGVGREVVIENGQAGYLKTALVAGAFFDVLGVEPILGRALTRADDVDGAERVLVISYGLWQRRYGGSRDIIGRHVTLYRPFTIVGVMPAGLDYPTGVEAWRATHSVSADGPFGDAARSEIDLVARLRPGVTIDQATSELAALTSRFETEHPRTTRGLVPVVRSFEDALVGDAGSGLIALMSAVALVLLIASVNAANLLLMRGEARRTELAIREALGAGRGRIARQMMLESLLLTVAAAAVGVAATVWSLKEILARLPDGLPRIDAVHVDGTVLGFSVAAALATAVLVGLVPALWLARANLSAHLGRGARTVTGPGSRRGRRALIVGQIAIAVTVVAAAGLLTRTLMRLQAVDLGLAAERLVFVELLLPQSTRAARARHADFLDRAIAALEAGPITAATPVNVTPFSGDGGWDVPKFTAYGQTSEQAAANPSLNLESVYPNYFTTFDVPIVHGRAFTAADRDGALPVAIISDDVARRLWPGEDPLGRRIKMGGPDSGEDDWLTVVGLAAPTRYRDLTRARPTLYLPAAQFLQTAELLVLRTAAPLPLVASIARERMATVDPGVTVVRAAPFSEMLDRPLARPRFHAFLLGIFGVTALLLTTVGLYAVMAGFVRQRDREIAVRMALGATRANVRRLVLAESISLAGLGAAIGLGAAAAATRLLRGLLFEIDALDPATLLASAALLVAAAVLASSVPLRRATRIDAVATLRN